MVTWRRLGAGPPLGLAVATLSEALEASVLCCRDRMGRRWSPQTCPNQTEDGEPETPLHPETKAGWEMVEGEGPVTAATVMLGAGASLLTTFCRCPWPSSVPTAAPSYSEEKPCLPVPLRSRDGLPPP